MTDAELAVFQRVIEAADRAGGVFFQDSSNPAGDGVPGDGSPILTGDQMTAAYNTLATLNTSIVNAYATLGICVTGAELRAALGN